MMMKPEETGSDLFLFSHNNLFFSRPSSSYPPATPWSSSPPSAARATFSNLINPLNFKTAELNGSKFDVTNSWPNYGLKKVEINKCDWKNLVILVL